MGWRPDVVKKKRVRKVSGWKRREDEAKGCRTRFEMQGRRKLRGLLGLLVHA